MVPGEPLTGIDGDTARLLAVDILTRFGSGDRRGCVPAIAGRDQNGIDVVSPEQFAEVAVQLAVFVSVMTIDHPLALIASHLLHIGDRGHSDVVKLQHRSQVVPAPGTDSDHPQIDAIVLAQPLEQPKQSSEPTLRRCWRQESLVGSACRAPAKMSAICSE